jgi:hypothetical protein
MSVMGRAFALLLAIAACGCSEAARAPGGGGGAEAPASLPPGPRRAEQAQPPPPRPAQQAGPAEPDYPPALRSPTRAEADRIAASCGTRVRRATMRGGLLRLAAWAAYEPVGATPAQERCFYHRIRLLVGRPAPRRG